MEGKGGGMLIKSKVARKLYSCEEPQRPWHSTSDSDTSQSDSNNEIVVRPHHRGFCSESSPCKYLPPIGVFWDIENCQIPKGRSAVAVAQAIRDKFHDGYREAEFLVVCDVKKESAQVVEELNDAQVNLIHVGSQSKNAADDKLRQSIRRFADIHGSPAAIVLISGDINFAPDLCDLRNRKKIHVILVHNEFCSESLILCANQHFSFPAIVANLPVRGGLKAIHQAAEIRVGALPVACDPGKIRKRLRQLTDNCGGKVSEITGENAAIRFNSLQAAMRAYKRMEGAKINGIPILIGEPTITNRKSLKDSPSKGFNQRMISWWDVEKRGSGYTDQAEISNRNFWMNSPNRFRFYGNFQEQKRSIYNQENLPIPIRNLTINPIQGGRKILARREINLTDLSGTTGASGRHSLDSMLDGAEFDGEKKPMWNASKSGEWSSQSSKEVRKCQTPSPHLATFPVNTSLPPPPIINLPQKDGNQHVFHPIAVKPTVNINEPVDFVVTNLDQTVDIMLMKNHLTAIFNQCCLVMNVSMFVQEAGTIAANVRVHSQLDTETLLKTVQNRRIGQQQINVALVSSREYCTATNGNWRNPAQSAVPSTEVMPQSAAAESAELPSVKIRLSDLTEKLTRLVRLHNNCLPLASLLASYTAQYQQVRLDGNAVPLEHLVTCVPNIELVRNTSGKMLRFRTSPHSTENVSAPIGRSVELTLLGRELVELLKIQSGCRILFNRLVPAYRKHFGQHMRVSDYGYVKLVDLLCGLSDIVQVIGECDQRVVMLSHRVQTERFVADLLQLVSSLSSKQLSLRELPTLWEQKLGHALNPTDYGLCFVEDLLSLVPSDTLLVVKDKQDVIVSLPSKPTVPLETDRAIIFINQVVELLGQMPHFTLDSDKLAPMYYQHFKSHCEVADFCFTKLAELFEAVSGVIKVEEKVEGGTQLTLTLPERMKVLAQRMEKLVAPRYPPGLSLPNLNSAYLWEFGIALCPSDYECSMLVEVIGKLSTVKVVAANGSVMVVPASCSWEKMQILRTLRILWERSSGRMRIAEFEELHLRYYNVKPSRLSLVTELKDVVKVTQDAHVQLASLQLFARDVYRMLSSCDGRLALTMLEPAMKRTLDTTVTPSQYGCDSMDELLEAVSHVAHISGRGSKRLLVLNTQLADVGIPLPEGFGKSLNQSAEIESPVPSGTQSSQWNSPNSPNVLVNSPNVLLNKVVTPRKALPLITPSGFLQSSSLPLPSPPSPSNLPKPGNFNLTDYKVKEFIENASQCLESDQNKRRLRLAPHFKSPIQLK